MIFQHNTGIKPSMSDIELGRGVDGIVVELLDHPELVIKHMHNPLRLGRNRVDLELRVLSAVAKATGGLGATAVFNDGTDRRRKSWLVRERVFDVEPRGPQETRTELVRLIFDIHPNADVSLPMQPDPTFDNVRWGFTLANKTPRWILIDP